MIIQSACSPFAWHLMVGDLHDNSQTPIIPIIPIEEVTAELPFDKSATVNNSINPQPPASCPLISGNLPFSQCGPSESQDGSVHAESQDGHVHESPLNMLHGLGSGDLEIAAAVAATVAAIVQRKEEIDTELLIKCLTDPEMIKKLMNGNGLTSKPEDEAPPAPNADTCLPLPSLTPAAVVDKLANGGSEQVSKAVLPNSTPQAVITSSVLPCSKAETETNRLASKLVGMRAGSAQTCTSNTTKRPSPSPRLDSDRPTKKLTRECGRPTSRVDQVARQQKARPLVPSTLRPDEETTNRLIKKYARPDVTGAKPNPSTSKPNMEAAKRMIHDYGAPDVARVKPMAPLVLSTSISPNMEEIDRTVEKYLLPDHGWRRPFIGPSPPLFASTASPPVTNLHAWPNSLESHFNATGTFRPSFTPRVVPVEQVDVQYHKSLIKQHGKIHETGEDKFPKICQSGNYLQGVELGHKVTTINMNPKYKPCLYFGRSTGCRNGSNCPFQHDLSKQWRAAGAVVTPVTPSATAPVAKEKKLNERFGKWR